jgi:precorrin-6B methylase 2
LGSHKSGFNSIVSLCQGAWETKILYVALETGLFTRISGGAKSVDAISQESGIDIRLLQMVANACRAMGLIEEKEGSLMNSPGAEEFLVKGREGYVGDFIILVGEDYYDVWRGLREVVMTGRPVRDDRTVRLSSPRYAEAYIKAMHGISFGPASRLSGELPLAGRKSLLEVGGGPGTYSIMLARKNPGIKAVVFDSPFSCEHADKNIKAAGVNNVSTQGGDFERGRIPSGHDVIMLTHVLQSLPPPGCEALLKRVYEALPGGGMVVVNEFLLEEGGAAPAFSSLFALNAFMLSNGGSLHTRNEICEWLVNVGFSGVKAIKASEIIISLNARKVEK